MGRPPSDLDDYLEWQQRIESQKESGLSIDVYCLQEGVSRSSFYRWLIGFGTAYQSRLQLKKLLGSKPSRVRRRFCQSRSRHLAWR